MTIAQGVICCKWKPGTKEETVQVVLPRSQCGTVLKWAHSVLMESHIGQRSILRKIRQQFWWPGLKRDVSIISGAVPSVSGCQGWGNRRFQRLKGQTWDYQLRGLHWENCSGLPGLLMDSPRFAPEKGGGNVTDLGIKTWNIYRILNLQTKLHVSVVEDTVYAMVTNHLIA